MGRNFYRLLNMIIFKDDRVRRRNFSLTIKNFVSSQGRCPTLTTCAHVLRLYISSVRPSKKLKRLTAHVIRVYGCFWFSVKWAPKFENGPGHVLACLKQISKYSAPEEMEILHNTIQHNGYFLHPENVIVGMLASSDPLSREQAVRHVLRINHAEEDNLGENMRIFKVPKKEEINFYADKLSELSKCKDWNERIPVLKHVTNIESFYDLPFATEYECHSQGIERLVKSTSESVARVSLYQDGCTLYNQQNTWKN